MKSSCLKVGELAKLTGVSIRTLHYYDEIGLLSPRHSPSGYRLYGEKDVVRLQQVRSLRHLGLSLQEISNCLSGSGYSLHHVIDLHISNLRQQIAMQNKLLGRLESISTHLALTGEASIEDIIVTTEAMSRIETRLSTVQPEENVAGERTVEKDRHHWLQVRWRELIADVRKAMEAGKDSKSREARTQAEHFRSLIAELTDGSHGSRSPLCKQCKREPNTVCKLLYQNDHVLSDYLGDAVAALNAAEEGSGSPQ